MNQLANAIMASVKPNKNLGAACQGNWPSDATHAVDVLACIVDTPLTTYFSCQEDAEAFFDKRVDELLKNALVNHYVTMYDWDLGPNVMKETVAGYL